jgi:pyridoxal phosphate enzyme (YggS family)
MIHQNISELKKELGSVKLVVVSKYRSLEELNEVYATGHRLLGENRVQELRNKYEEMPKDVEWHMIGHLQKNKVKYIAPFIAMIHSVDSEGLLNEINKQAAKHDRRIQILLQVHVAQEESKFGLSADELTQLIESDVWTGLNNIEVKGLMAMATNTGDSF